MEEQASHIGRAQQDLDSKDGPFWEGVGGFHGHGGTQNGWFIVVYSGLKWKIPLKLDDYSKNDDL